MIAIPTVDETLAMARRLPLRERARLIALIAQDIAGEPTAETLWPPAGVTVQTPTIPLESIALLCGGTWDDQLPLRREELYDDRGRA